MQQSSPTTPSPPHSSLHCLPLPRSTTMCTHIHLTCRHCTQTYPKYSSILPCLSPTQRLKPQSYSPHDLSRLSVISLPPNLSTAATRPFILIPQRPPVPPFAYMSKPLPRLPPRPTHRPHSADSPTLGLHHPPIIRTPPPRPRIMTTAPSRMHFTRASSRAHPLTIPPRTSSLPASITHSKPPKPSSLRIITHAAPLSSHPIPLPPLPQHPQNPRSPHQNPDSDPRVATKCPRYTNRWSYITCSTCSRSDGLGTQSKAANRVQVCASTESRSRGPTKRLLRVKRSLRVRVQPLAKYERPYLEREVVEGKIREGRRRSWKGMLQVPVPRTRTRKDDMGEEPEGRGCRVGIGCVMM